MANTTPTDIKIEAVSTTETHPTITIEGWDIKDAELAQLLEETAQYLRSTSAEKSALENKEVMFKRISTGRLFDVVHRS